MTHATTPARRSPAPDANAPHVDRARPGRRLLTSGLLLAAVLTLGACGGGGYYFEPIGDAYVENQDVFATESFFMAPSGTGAWTGDLLGDYVYPGEVAYLGSFYEDYYDADAWQADGAIFPFDAVPIYDGLPTTFVVY